MTYYIKGGSLEVGRGVRVYAKDENGKPCGEYTGWWNPNRGEVVLYPAPGSWIYGRLTKTTIADRRVRRERICLERR